MDVNEGIQLEDLKGMLRRRRGLIAWTSGAVFLASIFLASVLPNEYVSSAVLLVEPQTISERLVEASQGGIELTQRLNLMAMEILSRSRLSRVIDDFGLYPEESKEMTREEVIELMRGHIEVVPVLPELEAEDEREREVDTFQISYRASNPRVAAEVTNRLANDFVEEHIRARTQTSGDTSEFIESELSRLARSIQEVEERIAAVKSENAGSLPEDFDGNQMLRSRAQDELREAEQRLAEAESEIAFYRQQALAAPPEPGVTTPEQKLQILELRLAEYKARGFTDKHPDVIATQEESRKVREGIAAAESKAVEEEVPRSALQENAEAEARKYELRAEAARREIERLREQIASVEERMAATPRVAERLDALNREHEHLYRSYQEFSQKRLEASVSANMERQVKGERFRVLESAVPGFDPASPDRPLILLLGALVGLALGGALAVALEALDTTFRSPLRLQTALQLPVLAAIPEILLEQDRRRLRRRRLRTAVLASGLTLVVLAGSGVGYVTVNGAPGALKALTASDEVAAPTPAPPAGEG
jgi:polysaccharide chain length determinant protein (PEP-CTERM system associated)